MAENQEQTIQPETNAPNDYSGRLGLVGTQSGKTPLERQPESYAGEFTWTDTAQQGLSFGKQPPEAPKLPVQTPSTVTPIPDTNVAFNRTEDASWALEGNTSVNWDEMLDSILAGKESDVRERTAQEQNILKLDNTLKSPNITMAKVHSALTPEDPSYYWETAFANKWMDTLTGQERANLWTDVFNKNPEFGYQLLETGKGIVAWNKILETAIQDNQTKLKNLSVASTVGHYAKEFLIPGLSAYQIRSAVTPGNILLSKNLTQQMDALMSIGDPVERGRALKAAMDKIGDPYLVDQFLQAMRGQSTDDKFVTDLLEGVGLIGAPGYGLAAKLALKGIDATVLTAGVKSMARSVNTSMRMNPETAARAAAGDMEGAAYNSIAHIMTRRFTPNATVNNPRAWLDRLFTNWDLEDQRLASVPVGRGGREITARLQDHAAVLKDKIYNRWINLMRINNLEPVMAMRTVVEGIWKDIRDQGYFRGLPDNDLLDHGNPLYNPLNNTYDMSAYFGDGGRMFQTDKAAREWMKLYNVEGMIHEKDISTTTLVGLEKVVKNQGTGYYVELRVPIRKDSPTIMNALKLAPGNQLPHSWLDTYASWMSKFRSPDETMAFQDRLERKIATYMPGVILKDIQDEAKGITRLARNGMLNRKKFSQWKRIVKQAQSDVDPVTGQGKWAVNHGQLQAKYQRLFNRDPDDQEIDAYFALKNIYEIEHAFQNAEVFHQVQSWGAQEYSIQTLDAEKNRISSAKFNARPVDHVPAGNHGVAFIGSHADSWRVTTGNKAGPNTVAKWNKAAQEGRIQILQAFRPDYNPLEGFAGIADEHIEYYIVHSAKSSPLSPIQVPRRGGGHFIPKYSHGVKQANIFHDKLTGLHRYNGDNLISLAPNASVGKHWAKTMEEVRQLIKNKDIDRAKDLVMNNLHKPWEEIWQAFHGGKDITGRHIKASLSLEHSIHYAPLNTHLIDTEAGTALRQKYGDKFIDSTRMGNPGMMQQVRFTQERDVHDLTQIRNKGTMNNPIWSYEPAEFIDPLPALERSVNPIVNSMWMDQYKINAIRRWLDQGFEKQAFGVDEKDIRQAPFYYFHHPDELYAKQIDPVTKRMLEGNRWKIQQFVGMKSNIEAEAHSYTQRLADTLYGKGFKGDSKLLNILEWAQEKDPHRFIRSVVFHKSLGLFSIPIFFLHMMTMANGMMIAGAKTSVKGFTGGLLHLWSSFNGSEKTLKALDRIASGMGYRPGEWMESRQLAHEMGFLHEPGTYSFAPDTFDNKLITTPFGKFLKFGLFPFDKGLQAMRGVSWHMAYHEFRNGGGGKFGWAGKVGRLTNADKAQILERADILAHNMTKASASYLTTGWRATPMQFMTYHERLTELAMGQRLTKAEKTRFWLGNAALYGIGAPLSLATFGLAGEWQQTAMEKGYQVGKNNMLDLMLNGIPSFLVAHLSGDDVSTQTWLDVKGRYSPKGLFENWAREDPHFWDLLLGATGTTFSDGLAIIKPFYKAMISMVPGSGYQERWPITIADTLEALRRISSSSNNVIGAWIAANSGNITSRRGDILETDMPLWYTLQSFMLGIKDLNISNIYAQRAVMSSQKAAEDKIAKEMLTYFKRGYEAVGQSNTTQADDYFKQGWALYDQGNQVSQRRLSQILRDLQYTNSQVEEGDAEYYNLKRFPTGKFDEMLNQSTYERTIRGHQ